MSSEAYSVPASAGWTSKRVAGVPVVYLAGAVVAILIMVAYLGSKKKNTTGAPVATATTSQVPVDPYTTLASTGTVTTSQPVYYVPSNTQNVDTATVATMSSWQSGAVSYLIAQGVAPTDAQTAIVAYANGQDMTYAEKALVDKAIVGYGMPPTVSSVGAVKAINYADPSTYVAYENVVGKGYFGILPDGTTHYLDMPTWLALGHPDSKLINVQP